MSGFRGLVEYFIKFDVSENPKPIRENSIFQKIEYFRKCNISRNPMFWTIQYSRKICILENRLFGKTPYFR